MICDLKGRLLHDKNSYCTTLFDFYGLPHDFPGKQEAISKQTIEEKQNTLHQIFIDKLTQNIGVNAMKRFFPYVQMYEFEGLLFSSPSIIASEIGKASLAEEFQNIRNFFITPEHINNSEITAPSKRIKKLFHEYEKVTHGSLIAIETGIEKICNECYLFNDWVNKLKSLPPLN